MLEYSRTSRDELAAVVEFIAPLNVKAEHRIGYLGDKPEEITQELLEYGPSTTRSWRGRTVN